MGVATGILGIISVAGPFLVSALGLAVILASVLTTVWAFLVGHRLYRLGTHVTPATTQQPGYCSSIFFRPPSAPFQACSDVAAASSDGRFRSLIVSSVPPSVSTSCHVTTW